MQQVVEKRKGGGDASEMANWDGDGAEIEKESGGCDARAVRGEKQIKKDCRMRRVTKKIVGNGRVNVAKRHTQAKAAAERDRTGGRVHNEMCEAHVTPSH